jgi:alkanesulfonate monooxygenase SsuD/methylene tetrahydromethanopterin reductase-like flavin-dependent oxidoreductase (luciferase family)
MREFISALRAIWNAWQRQEPLRFQGEHYRHTLMTPMFAPPPHEWGAPPVYLAAVGPLMTGLAGEVADGLLAHGFTTERYLRERTLPALEEGLRTAGRGRDQVAVTLPGLVVSGGTEEEMAEAALAVKATIAFYGSTRPTGRCSSSTVGRRWPTSCTRCRSVAPRTSGRRCAIWSTTRSWRRSRRRRAGRRRGRGAAALDGVVDRFSVYASYPARRWTVGSAGPRLPLTAVPAAPDVRNTAHGNHCQ